MNVLIVDDQPEVVESMVTGVNWEKIPVEQVFTAYSVKEAQSVFERERIDVLLCDIEMPPTNGFALLRWAQERFSGLVCIFLSAHAEFEYAQEHLRLTSFCYGLLRPLDVIRSYRLEGDVVLPEPGNQTMFSYWKSRLTDVFIEDIKKAGGILCNLASDEMKSLFDWKRVEREVRVVTPEFQVWKNGKLASIVIYIKMSRGEMTRFILKNRIENPEGLKSFSWEGFEFNESLSDEKKFVFTNGKEI